MCGICGFIGRGEFEDLKRMNSAMSHRGPDEEGFWQNAEPRVLIGHRRLSIIDLHGGSQPMETKDGQMVVSYNGLIYNHLELRHELIEEGHNFKTDHSDTEVLLHGYREWKENLPLRLNGMWAFAIYDRTEKTLFLSRDRFGKKPLYYTLQNGTFAFASELSALAKHSLVNTSISKRSLKKYFAYGYIPAPNSLYLDIYKLPAGHNLFLNAKDLRPVIKKYWDFVLEPFEDIPKNAEEEWGAQLRELLERAVERRLMSDVPLGVFLSGGIDSSSVTAFAARHVSQGKLKTFTIGFEETSFDESVHAKKISDLFHTHHFEKKLSIDRARGILPEILTRLDEPMGDRSLLPTYLLCKMTRKHVTVAIGGDGGDELFAGYDIFRALRMSEFYDTIVPRPIHQAIKMLANYLPMSYKNMSFDFRLKRTLRGLSYSKSLWPSIWLGPLEPKDIDELFFESTDIEDLYSEAIESWEDCPQTNLKDKVLQFYTKLYLQDDILVKSDRASMMNSLEVRAPFLDIELVNFVRKIPHSYKYRNGQTKYILKKALAPILPKDILYRQKKGFGVPVGNWLKEKLFMISPSSFPGMLNEKYTERAFKEHLNGLCDHRAFLWNWWVLEKVIPQGNRWDFS